MKIGVESLVVLLNCSLELQSLPCDSVAIAMRAEAFEAMVYLASPYLDVDKVDYLIVGGILIVREGETKEKIESYRLDNKNQNQINYLTNVEVHGHA